MPCGAAYAEVNCALGSHSAAALLEHKSLRVNAILFVRAKKLVSVEDAPSTLLRSARGEDKYPWMLMFSSLIQN